MCHIFKLNFWIALLKFKSLGVRQGENCDFDTYKGVENMK